MFYFPHRIPPHLLQWQYELGDALLAAEVGQQFVGVHTLAVSCLHQLGDDPLHLFLRSHGSEQLVVEDLTKAKTDKYVFQKALKSKINMRKYDLDHVLIEVSHAILANPSPLFYMSLD